MKANIKESTYWLLKDIGLRGIEARPEVQGDKLKAIYRLIQRRGEVLQTNCKDLQGVKALEFAEGEYLAMRRNGPKNSFPPCAIKTILLNNL